VEHLAEQPLVANLLNSKIRVTCVSADRGAMCGRALRIQVLKETAEQFLQVVVLQCIMRFDLPLELLVRRKTFTQAYFAY
jgi:hypothetical protein